VIGTHNCTRYLLPGHWEAFKLAEFLAMEGAWFEFLPHDNDTYIVAVQPSMDGAVTFRLNMWHVPVERMTDG